MKNNSHNPSKDVLQKIAEDLNSLKKRSDDFVAENNIDMDELEKEFESISVKNEGSIPLSSINKTSN